MKRLLIFVAALFALATTARANPSENASAQYLYVTAATAQTLTWTPTATSNPLWIMEGGIETSGSISSVKSNGITWTFLTSTVSASSPAVDIEFWYTTSATAMPAGVLTDITVTASASREANYGILELTGVNQSSPIGNYAVYANASGSSNPSFNFTPTNNNGMIVNALDFTGSDTTTFNAYPSNFTLIQQVYSTVVNGAPNWASLYENYTTAGSTTIAYTLSTTRQVAEFAVEVDQPNYTATPTQTPTVTYTPTSTYTPIPCNQTVIPDIAAIATPNPYKSPTYYNSFAPPVTSPGQLPASCAPVIANYDKLVEGNHTFFLTGENLSAAFLYACGQSPSGVFLTCTAIPNSTSEQWPQYAPNNAYIGQGVCMMWAASGTTGAYSLPVLVNAPHLWSCAFNGLSDTVAAPGDWGALTGSNCMNSANPVTPSVEIYNGTTSYLATVGSYTPFSIYFQIPGGIATGTWSVQFNNGTGGSGEYGWSNVGTLTIASNPYTGGVFNCITSYGCAGNGTTDDTAAVAATITNAAASKGIAYFEGVTNCSCAGVYKISSAISLASYDNIQGDGPNATLLSFTANYSGAYGIGSTSGTKKQYLTMKSIGIIMNSISSSAASGGSTSDSVVPCTYCENMLLQNVSVTCGINQYDGVAMTAFKFATGGGSNVTGPLTVENCNFYAGDCLVNFPPNTLIYNPAFYIRYGGAAGGAAGVSNVLIDMANQYNFDSSGLTEGSSDGNMFEFSIGDNSNVVEQNSTCLGQGTPTDSTNYNAGQPFLFEGMASTFSQVTITSATASGAVISGDGGSSYSSGNYHIMIVSGPGEGQYANITADSAGTLTLDRAWNEVPMSSSFAVVCYLNESVGLWNDQASSDTSNNVNATANGFEFYGGGADIYVMNCKATTENIGFYLYSSQRSTELGAEGFNYFWNDSASGLFTISANAAIGFNHQDQMVTPNTREGIYNMADEFYDGYVSTSLGYAFQQQISDNGGLAVTGATNMDGTSVQGFSGMAISPAVGMQNNAGLIRNLDFIDGSLVQEAGSYVGALNFWNSGYNSGNTNKNGWLNLNGMPPWIDLTQPTWSLP